MAVSATEDLTRFTGLRWSIFASMYLGYAICVLNRKSFSYAVPAIVKEEGFNNDQLGLIASSQNLAYAISKFLGGLLSDTISPKILFSSSLFLSGLVCILFTGFSSVWVLTSIWFLSGLFQGGAWPACAKILKKWYSPEEFGTWWSVLSTSMNVAGSTGPLLAAFIITEFGSWRISFQMFGGALMVASGLCAMSVIDSPEDVGFDGIGKDEKGKTKGRGRGTWKDMMKSPFLWVLNISYCVVYMIRTAALDWGQLYLIEEYGHSQYVGSMFTSSLETGGIVGSVAAGYLGDRIMAMSNREDTRGSPRMTLAICYTFTLTISLHAMIFLIGNETSQLFITIIGFMLGVSIYGLIVLYGVMAIEAAPTHLSGTSHALVALAANVGGIAAGFPLTLIANVYDWSGAFFFLEILGAGVFIMKVLMRNVEYKLIPIKKKSM